jgi:hypothetical protein
MTTPASPPYNLQALLADIASDEQCNHTAKRVLSRDEIRQIVKKKKQSPAAQQPPETKP